MAVASPLTSGCLSRSLFNNWSLYAYEDDSKGFHPH